LINVFVSRPLYHRGRNPRSSGH